MNIACGIEYDGTDFHGFQRQPDSHGLTVQGELESAIGHITDERVTVLGAGRTDAGVHAVGQVIHFRTEALLAPEIWVRALNANVPRSIAVHWAKEMPERFHARYSASSRSYRYTICSDPTPSPLLARFSYYHGRPLDVMAMNQACQALRGRKDFGAFGHSPDETNQRKPGPHSCVRTMHEARCTREQARILTRISELIYCDFTADAFLTGMVRRIVGTLVLVGQQRLSLDEFVAIVDKAEKTHPGTAAPPHGLCLVRVTYPEEYGVR